MLAKFFGFREKGTNARIEIGAGITTFMTMAYIIFVQPAVLSGKMFGFDTGMDFGAITVATCLAGSLATLIMGVYANYPIAQAPGMGENFFFVFTVIPAAAALISARGWQGTDPWQVALGVVFISGIIFLILSLLQVRQAIIDAVSPSLKNGIAVGIGLFIAFIGLQNAGIVVSAASIVNTPGGAVLSPGTLVKLTERLVSKDVLVFGVGLLIIAVLTARKVRGAILGGIFAGLLISMIFKKVEFAGVVSPPPSLAPTFFKMDLLHALAWKMWPLIIVFLFMDVFDTVGTLIGVSEQAGFIVNNRLPRAEKVLLSDAVGTVTGAMMGTSTVTSFIESAAGVAHGGRTGFASVVTAACFLLALFFSPLVKMVANYAPITAPALVVVGGLMIRNVVKVDWNDYTESLPAFLIMIGIPLSYSIADGIAWGFISYPLIKLFGGRARETSWLIYLVGGLFLARYAFPYLLK